jgi:hypothetical protein
VYKRQRETFAPRLTEGHKGVSKVAKGAFMDSFIHELTILIGPTIRMGIGAVFMSMTRFLKSEL